VSSDLFQMLSRSNRATPLSFVACISDESLLRANVLTSPCLIEPNSPHEMILVRAASDAASGLNLGLEQAKNNWIICIHQDVHLPEGWDQQLVTQLEEAERRFGPIGVAGVYGVGEAIGRPNHPLSAQRVGSVIDRGRTLRDGPSLPATVSTLDELLLVIHRDSPLRLDPSLGFHLYGADLCLQACEQGLAVVALEALCRHNSRSIGLPQAFFASAEIFCTQNGLTACPWPRRVRSSKVMTKAFCSTTRSSKEKRGGRGQTCFLVSGNPGKTKNHA
jgi:hypothetical protein